MRSTLSLQGQFKGLSITALRLLFGSRANTDNFPLNFKSHGPDLVAVVDVLSNFITGTDRENPILLKWVLDLQAAANHAFSQPTPVSSEVNFCYITAHIIFEGQA
jgi:hypothetical protein